MQLLINQRTYIKTLDAGYGVPTNGPVPRVPRTYASKLDLSGAYAFNPTKAESLLARNGWTKVGGVDTCTGGSCVAAGLSGTKLEFTLLYSTGTTMVTNQMTDLVDAFHSAGIDVTLKDEAQSTVLGSAGSNCFATGDCSWQAAYSNAGWVFDPDFLPTGEAIFDGKQGCSSPTDLAVSNAGGYCDATNHANILATTKSSSLSTLHAYENYLAEQLPVLWLPLAGHLTERIRHLYGVTPQNVFGAVTPENWGWEKGFVPPA